ncbi:hypothetical protein EJB05_13826, partial [Eragrostis curvula]
MPQALPEELVKEIVLRFPPDDPARLLGAALVCKDWCRLICGLGFRRRFREFHQNPPLLVIIYRDGEASTSHGSCSWIVIKTSFMPLSTFTLPSACKISSRDAIDALHSRILFCDKEDLRGPSAWIELVVWSPVPSQVRRLPLLRLGRRRSSYTWTAALLCAAAGCDHLDCGSGAFAVIFTGTDSIMGFTSAYVYSSEQDEWSKPISIRDRSVQGIYRPSARVGNTVYFLCEASPKLLAFELHNRALSFVGTPPTCWNHSFTAFTIADDDGGKLGFAAAQDSYLWMVMLGGHRQESLS